MLLSSMKDNTIAKKASLDFYSSFNGSMHIGVKSKKAAISEIYIGNFNVTQRIKKKQIIPQKDKRREMYDLLQ